VAPAKLGGSGVLEAVAEEPSVKEEPKMEKITPGVKGAPGA
jgi:hypothetical protein